MRQSITEETQISFDLCNRALSIVCPVCKADIACFCNHFKRLSFDVHKLRVDQSKWSEPLKSCLLSSSLSRLIYPEPFLWMRNEPRAFILKKAVVALEEIPERGSLIQLGDAFYLVEAAQKEKAGLFLVSVWAEL